MTATVILIGRPNVGKSTLFNRLIGKRLALVDDTPGVTRDRREGEAHLGGLHFKVVDTAGLEESFDESLPARMRRQTEQALGKADVALLIVDARAGVTPLDEHFSLWLRKQKIPVVLVANKCESDNVDIASAYKLGLGDPVIVSAEHGQGMAELVLAIEPHIQNHEPEEFEEKEIPLRLAVVGRPNVGKSTFINQLLGEDRLLTGPEAGITRDSIEVDYAYKNHVIKLVDTAGIRRRPKVQEKLEKLSVQDSLNTIRFANVVILMLDATQELDKQDLVLASMVENEGRALVVAANKWDLVKDQKQTLTFIKGRLQKSLAQLPDVPVITMSGLKGNNLDELMDRAVEMYRLWNKRISTSKLNQWLEIVTGHHPPPLASGRRLKIRYITQVKSRPPTFALFVNKPDELPDNYLRYLSNDLRKTFDMPGVPMRLQPRKGENPYANKKVKK